MSLFDVTENRDIPNEIALNLLNTMNAEAERRVGVHKDAFNAFWNSNEATPQEIADKMGTNAGKFFALASQNVTHISACAQIAGKSLSDYLQPVDYLPPHPVTVHQDGTVTIG